MALNIHVQLFSPGNAWLIAQGKNWLHAIYNQGFRNIQKKFEGGSWVMELWLLDRFGRIRIWGKGDIGFEFFTTGKPVYVDTTTSPSFDILKNIAVRTSARLVEGNVKFASRFGNTERSIYGSDSSIFPKREAQIQLVSEPQYYLSQHTEAAGRRLYEDYVSESFAPMHSHSGIHYRSAIWGGLAGEATISTGYQHSLRDYEYDLPFTYGKGLEPQVSLYHTSFDWPRGCMKQKVKQKVAIEGQMVELTRTFGIVIDASHKIYVFPLDQCDPSAFDSWPPNPGTGGIPDDHKKEAAYTWPAWVWAGTLGTQQVREYHDVTPGDSRTKGMIDYPEYAFEFSEDGKKCCAVVYSRGPKIEYDATYFNHLHSQSNVSPYSLIGYPWIQAENYAGGGWNFYQQTSTISNTFAKGINDVEPFGHVEPGYNDDLYYWATGLVEIDIKITLETGDFSNANSWSVEATPRTIINPATHTGGAPVAAGYVWYDTVDKEKGKPGDLIWLECAIWYKASEAQKKYEACYAGDPKPDNPYHWPIPMRGREHLHVVYNVRNHTAGTIALSFGGMNVDYTFFDWNMKAMSFAVWARIHGEVERFSVESVFPAFTSPISMKGKRCGWAVVPVVLGREQQHIVPSTQPVLLTKYLSTNAVPAYNVAAYLLSEGWEQIPLNFGINGWDDFGGTTSSDRMWLVAHNTNSALMDDLAYTGTPIQLTELKLKYAHSFGEDWGTTWPDFFLGMATTIRPGWNIHMEQLALRTLLNMGSTQSFSVHPTGSYSIFIDHLNYWSQVELPDLHEAADDDEIFPNMLWGYPSVYKLADRYVTEMQGDFPPEHVVIDRIHVRFIDVKGKEVGAADTSYLACYNRAVVALDQDPDAPEPFNQMTYADFRPGTFTPLKHKMDKPFDNPADPWPYKLMFKVTSAIDPAYTYDLAGWTYLYQEHVSQPSAPLVDRSRSLPFSFWTKQHWAGYDFSDNPAWPNSFPLLSQTGWLRDIRVDGCWFYGG